MADHDDRQTNFDDEGDEGTNGGIALQIRALADFRAEQVSVGLGVNEPALSIVEAVEEPHSKLIDPLTESDDSRDGLRIEFIEIVLAAAIVIGLVVVGIAKLRGGETNADIVTPPPSTEAAIEQPDDPVDTAETSAGWSSTEIGTAATWASGLWLDHAAAAQGEPARFVASAGSVLIDATINREGVESRDEYQVPIEAVQLGRVAVGPAGAMAAGWSDTGSVLVTRQVGAPWVVTTQARHFTAISFVQDTLVTDTGFFASGAGGLQAVVWRSPNGNTWTDTTLPGAGEYGEAEFIASHDGVLVVHGEVDGNAATWRSTDDAATWSLVDGPARLGGLISDGDGFWGIESVEDETSALWHSADGLEWSSQPLEWPILGSDAPWRPTVGRMDSWRRDAGQNVFLTWQRLSTASTPSVCYDNPSDCASPSSLVGPNPQQVVVVEAGQQWSTIDIGALPGFAAPVAENVEGVEAPVQQLQLAAVAPDGSLVVVTAFGPVAITVDENGVRSSSETELSVWVLPAAEVSRDSPVAHEPEPGPEFLAPGVRPAELGVPYRFPLGAFCPQSFGFEQGEFWVLDPAIDHAMSSLASFTEAPADWPVVSGGLLGVLVQVDADTIEYQLPDGEVIGTFVPATEAEAAEVCGVARFLPDPPPDFDSAELGPVENSWDDRPLAATETLDLVDGDVVAITGGGFTPGSRVIGGFCLDVDRSSMNAVANCGTNFDVVDVAEDGSFELALIVDSDRGRPGVDCAADPCLFVVALAPDGVLPDFSDAVATPLTFASDG